MQKITDLVVLLCIVLFLLTFFQPQLLFLKTTINGGDTGSHYPCAAYLKEVLLPQGKIMGWMQGNYAGFPLFYHYFPLPFLLAALLSFLLSLEVSFKLITVLGIFLLPFSIYFAFRALKYAFPVPIIAAIFTLPFLFNQGNSMWGGNIPSTLAGEFCYSLSFAFLFLFFGTLYRGATENKFLILNALLVFLIAFSHAYTLIFAFILGAFFLLLDLKRNFKYIFCVYGTGLLISSFWLLPVMLDLPYSTSFVFRWTLGSVFEILPLSLLPFIALSLFAFFRQRKDPQAIYFAYAVLACVFTYIVGPKIGILDIRFVPFFQLLLTLFGATLFFDYAKQFKFSFLLPVIILLMIMLWVNTTTTYIRNWIDWNYSGYESKATWKTFSGINEYLKNSGAARVEWEHTPKDEALGSIRSSETLPYFAKKQTLEGIHMLGAISAPFVFYIESETSAQACNPIPDYFYSTLDLKRGIEHFKLFNVTHFVVRSDEVKQAIKSFPEFRLVKTVDDYNIYHLTTADNRYVVPLKTPPVFMSAKKWRDSAYLWFASGRSKDLHYIYSSGPPHRVVQAFRPASTNISVKSTLNAESIDIETTAIGYPLLVKVSYHPNWHADSGDKIYLASPSFMVIFPSKNKVRLIFTQGSAGVIGKLLTVIGIVILFTSPLWFKKQLQGIREINTARAVHILITIGAFAFLFIILGLFFPDSDAVLKKGRTLFDKGKYAQARDKFQIVINKAKLSSGVRCEAGLYYAECFVRENKFKEAKMEFLKFINEYPASFWTPQAYFDLAYCEINLGNKADAINLYRQIINKFPTTSWAKYARERLGK